MIVGSFYSLSSGFFYQEDSTRAMEEQQEKNNEASHQKKNTYGKKKYSEGLSQTYSLHLTAIFRTPYRWVIWINGYRLDSEGSKIFFHWKILQVLMNSVRLRSSWGQYVEIFVNEPLVVQVPSSAPSFRHHDLYSSHRMKEKKTRHHDEEAMLLKNSMVDENFSQHSEEGDHDQQFSKDLSSSYSQDSYSHNTKENHNSYNTLDQHKSLAETSFPEESFVNKQKGTIKEESKKKLPPDHKNINSPQEEKENQEEFCDLKEEQWEELQDLDSP